MFSTGTVRCRQRANTCNFWDIIGPMMDQVAETGEVTWSQEFFSPMFRCDHLEEKYFTLSYGPIPDEQGRPGGIFNAWRKHGTCLG